MEFLRFGSSIPGSYWGCCACDIIQNFKVDPAAKASIQVCSGDGGGSLGFIGHTWKDIFLQRLRFGTFSTSQMPNHAFIAILTASQISSGYGKEWMAILKEQGFEFIRRVDNSVYTGQGVGAPTKTGEHTANYVFALFRNAGTQGFKDQFTPPEGWSSLPSVIPEAWEHLSGDTKELTASIANKHRELFDALPPLSLLTEAQLDEKKTPVTYCGIRSGSVGPNIYQFREGAPQELRENREKRLAERVALRGKAPPVDNFPTKGLVQTTKDAF